jgi:hypothetical protein
VDFFGIQANGLVKSVGIGTLSGSDITQITGGAGKVITIASPNYIEPLADDTFEADFGTAVYAVDSTTGQYAYIENKKLFSNAATWNIGTLYNLSTGNVSIPSEVYVFNAAADGEAVYLGTYSSNATDSTIKTFGGSGAGTWGSIGTVEPLTKGAGSFTTVPVTDFVKKWVVVENNISKFVSFTTDKMIYETGAYFSGNLNSPSYTPPQLVFEEDYYTLGVGAGPAYNTVHIYTKNALGAFTYRGTWGVVVATNAADASATVANPTAITISGASCPTTP